MNWKALVESNNAKTFVLPEGWDSRETVALQLGCAPAKVSEHLAPAIQARTVEMKLFTVWDRQLKMKLRVTAYRAIQRPPVKKHK